MRSFRFPLSFLLAFSSVVGACSSTPDPPRAIEVAKVQEPIMVCEDPPCRPACPIPHGGITAWDSSAFEQGLKNFGCHSPVSTFVAMVSAATQGSSTWWLSTECPNTQAVHDFVAQYHTVYPYNASLASEMYLNDNGICVAYFTTSTSQIVRFDPNCSGCWSTPSY